MKAHSPLNDRQDRLFKHISRPLDFQKVVVSVIHIQQSHTSIKKIAITNSF